MLTYHVNYVIVINKRCINMSNLQSLSKDNRCEKVNILNEMRSNSMTLQELRFLSIYLSKINARDEDTRVVRFQLDEFKKIMELGRLNIKSLKDSTARLLQKVVSIPDDNGGYSQFQLFSDIEVKQYEYGSWYIEIDCHNKALPLFFNFKKNYFTFELWNELRLKSVNQIRMYEILKQHQRQATYIFELKELRELLAIKESQYKRFGDFKTYVLEPCKIALAKNTDIIYNYELIKKGAKVIAIKFFIEKNKNYKNPLRLEDFLTEQELDGIKKIRQDNLNLLEDSQDTEDLAPAQPVFNDDNLEYFADACNFEFLENEMQLIYDLLLQMNFDNDIEKNKLKRYGYLKRKYNEMNFRQPKKSRFGYLKTLLNLDIESDNFLINSDDKIEDKWSKTSFSETDIDNLIVK